MCYRPFLYPSIVMTRGNRVSDWICLPAHSLRFITVIIIPSILSKSAYYIFHLRISFYPGSLCLISLREICKTLLFRIFRACRHFHFFFFKLRFIHTYQLACYGSVGSAAFPPVKYTYHSLSDIITKEFPWIILLLHPDLLWKHDQRC